jgi:glutaredoxin
MIRGPARFTLFAILTALLLLAAFGGGCSCSKRVDDGITPEPKGALPPLTVRDDSPDLMLTWIDDKGDPHVEMHPADVPAEGRAMVRVIVSDQEAGTHELVYVTDLTKKRDDGSYQATSMSRRAWEDQIEKRRDAYLAKVAPPPPPPPAAPATGNAAPEPRPPPLPGAVMAGATVIIYGASWCGPCHQAQSYLRSKGVPFVMKDIEETQGAAEEMRSKLQRAGMHGGSIPVIDVRGQIMVGFSPSEIDRALAKGGSGTVL